MRVCVVAEYYPRRRDPVLGVWAHRQALAARDAGAEVSVLALERPLPSAATLRSAARGRPGRLGRELRGFARQPRRDVLDGIEVEYVRFASPPRERAYADWHRWARRPLRRALERAYARRPFDLVHAHYAHLAGAAALPWAADRGLPLAVSVHGGDLLAPMLAAPAARATVAAVLRASAVTMCNSRATLAAAAALAGGEQRMRVVHPPGEPPPSPPPPRHDEPTVATLAHVIPRKRHADVLEAVAHVAGLRWVVIGEGPALPALQARARELGVGDRVRWAGELEPAAALRELARCHLMAMPSVDEAFGVAYVEALACGIPAIGCAGEGGPAEIAAAGEGMVLVPPRDPPALASAIGQLIADGDRLAALSEAARRTAHEHFGREACGRATVAAYREAIANSEKGSDPLEGG
jgi:glycosyltransferase involved in cell wall biosynthesis